MDNKEKGNFPIIISIIIVALIVVAVIYGVIKKKKQDLYINTIATNTPEEVNNTSNETEVKGSVDTNKNMEKVVKSGDMIAVNYTGKLTNGSVFDSNVDPKFNHVEPFVFTIGAGQVIQGWEEGFIGMKVGEKKILTIPPEKGYGAAGHPPVIPQNATLIFEVELVAIK